MSSFGYLFIKEAKQFFGNPFMPVVLVLLPVLLMLLVPLAANMEVRDVSLSIVDRDRSSLSARLSDRISRSGYFVLKSVEDTYGKAMDELSRGNVDIILEIPAGTERAVRQCRQQHQGHDGRWVPLVHCLRLFLGDGCLRRKSVFCPAPDNAPVQVQPAS